MPEAHPEAMIFRRTVINELSNSLGGVFTVLFSIVITVGLVRILGQAAGGRVDPASVFELMAYTGLSNLPPILALSLYIAILMVLIRTWQDNEMVVWFSSGSRNLLHFIPPVAIFAAPVIAVIAALSIVVSPWANGQIDRSSAEFRQRDDVSRISPGRFIESLNGARVFFIEEVAKDGAHVKNIFMSEKATSGKEVIVHAAEGEIKVNQYGDRYILLKNGRRYESGSGSGANWRVMDFATYELLLEVKADSIYAAKDAESMPIEILFLRRSPINNAQILWRFSWPIASIVLMLMAIPLSYTNPRQGRSISLVVAVLIFIMYLNGITMMQTWVKAQKISWIEGLVLVNSVMLALACLLFVRRVWMQSWLPRSWSRSIRSARRWLPGKVKGGAQ